MTAPPTRRWLSPDLALEVHLGGEDTGGAFCLFVDHPDPGWSLPPHRHVHEAETMHIVEGQFSVVVAGEERRVGPGDTIHVPVNTVHAGANVGTTTGRRLLIFSPAGLERFFLEASGPAPDQLPEQAEVLELAQRYGFEFIPRQAAELGK